MDELKRKIDIVLNEEKRAYKANGRRGGGLGSFSVGVGDGWTRVGVTPRLISDNPNLDSIKSANAELLLKLYSSLNSEKRTQFKEILLSYLSKDTPYLDVGYLIFFVLHRVGETITAIRKARSSLKGGPDHGFSNLLAMLAKIVSHEHSFISKELYDQIKEAMQGEDEPNFQLFEKINSAELELLKRELSDVNPEINEDREKFISLWVEKFGSEEIPSVIDGIEENFTGGDFNPTKFATCIDRVRVLLVDVLRDMAVQISQMEKDGRIDSKSNEHALFDYLRSKKFLSDSEWQLVKALYGISSDKGSHTAIALKEYARITKNMVYEVLLLVLSKYEQG